MPFRLWFYLTKVGPFIIFAAFVVFLMAPANTTPLRIIAECTLILLGVVGAIFGILMVIGQLRMRCPFCQRSGKVGGDKQNGMWMICQSCGYIHGSGPLGLKIVSEKIPEDTDDSDDES